MLGTQMQAAQLNIGNKDNQFNMGNKETHIANNVVNPNLAISSSFNTINALTMAGILYSTCLDLRHSIFSTPIMNTTTFNGDTWVIDTGATNHIVHSVHILTDLTAINCVVELPNGETALVTHIGSTSICLSETLILTNVLCVPSFSFDLLSVSQITKKVHCCLVFLSAICFI